MGGVSFIKLYSQEKRMLEDELSLSSSLELDVQLVVNRDYIPFVTG